MTKKSCHNWAIYFVIQIILFSMLIRTEFIGELGERFIHESEHETFSLLAMQSHVVDAYEEINYEFDFCENCQGSFLDFPVSDLVNEWCEDCCHKYQQERGELI